MIQVREYKKSELKVPKWQGNTTYWGKDKQKRNQICKTHFKWIRILLGKKALEFINAVTTK